LRLALFFLIRARNAVEKRHAYLEAIEIEMDKVRENLGYLEVRQLFDLLLVLRAKEGLAPLDHGGLEILCELIELGEAEDVDEVGVLIEQVCRNLI
jgi:hypothetical protein